MGRKWQLHNSCPYNGLQKFERETENLSHTRKTIMEEKDALGHAGRTVHEPFNLLRYMGNIYQKSNIFNT